MCEFVQMVQPIAIAGIFAVGIFAGLVIASLVMTARKRFDQARTATLAERAAVLRDTLPGKR